MVPLQADRRERRALNMPTLDVATLPDAVPDRLPPLCVVIDVLRATTMIGALLDAGCVGVVPAGSVERAREESAHRRALLAGERGGVPPEGFDMGNSPARVRRDAVGGRTVVLTTTNGTRAVERVRGASSVLALSLNNLDALARWTLGAGLDTLVVCSGTDGGRSPEDELAAGLFSSRLLGEGWCLTPSARTIFESAEAAVARSGGLEQAVRGSPHATRLVSLGFDDDVRACARESTSSCVPMLDAERGMLVPG